MALCVTRLICGRIADGAIPPHPCSHYMLFVQSCFAFIILSIDLGSVGLQRYTHIIVTDSPVSATVGFGSKILDVS
jgi:hypothetical protein